jgi:hypothetical protein
LQVGREKQKTNKSTHNEPKIPYAKCVLHIALEEIIFVAAFLNICKFTFTFDFHSANVNVWWVMQVLIRDRFNLWNHLLSVFQLRPAITPNG